ncbi:MAG: VWA domain-containing protein [Anaerolineae bacterium]|nr:VWA domain-containing protein [Anaerolineae bacterium]
MKKRLVHRERGQSLVLVAFGIFVLLGFAGLAVDLGLSYVERVRTQRAADAASLAAASELPLEGAAHLRALEYLAQNSYDCGLTPVGNDFVCQGGDVRVEINGQALRGDAEPTGDDVRVIIRINTADYRKEGGINTADKIRVEVLQQVRLYFMPLFSLQFRKDDPFERVSVMGQAIAENINDLDVALVFDRSGSMEFDTRCYGCWTPNGSDYPGGNLYPLPWGGPATGNPTHCQGNTPLVYGGRTYFIIEAEEYSSLSVSYNPALVPPGKTFWVISRNGSQAPSYMGNARAYGRDVIGGYLAHHPGRTHSGADGLGVTCSWGDLQTAGSGMNFPEERVCLSDEWVLNHGGPFEAPRADYDFTVPVNASGPDTTWYIWIRGQGGNPDTNLFWGISGGSYGSYNLIGQTQFGTGSTYENGAASNKWVWRKMGSGSSGSLSGAALNLNEGQDYTLHIWAGAAGFDVDRIIITNDDQDPRYADSSLDDNVLRSSHIDNNRTDWACDPCDARFGGNPGGTGGSDAPLCASFDRRTDPIFDDEQPIRGAIEASKAFIRRLDPKFDQIAYVYYSSSATIRSKLECARRLGADNCTMDIFENNVISKLSSTTASGSTNIADGIRQGVIALSSSGTQYGRPGAAHIMILMTDGEANVTPSDGGICYAEDYWPQNLGDNSRDRAKDCSIYYAMEARRNGVVIYTITLGETADIELMQGIAEITGGIHRHAPRPEQLEPIFDELYRRIFLRIVE